MLLKICLDVVRQIIKLKQVCDEHVLFVAEKEGSKAQDSRRSEPDTTTRGSINFKGLGG